MSSTEVIEGAKGEAINAFLGAMEQEANFTGAVLIEQEGKMILCKGYGKSHGSVPNTSETVFHIASLTKQFTAAAIMKLVEEKKIDLEASINEYLPTRFYTDEWEDVTVDNLLTHTSGIPNYADWDDYWDICKNLTVDKVIEDVRKEGLMFPPGSNQCYSNTGIRFLEKSLRNKGICPTEILLKKNCSFLQE